LRRQHIDFVVLPNQKYTFSLRKNGVILTQKEFVISKPHRGRVEKVDSKTVNGWLATNDGQQIADYEVHVNSILFKHGKADRGRSDLIKKGIAKQGGGFQVELFNPSLNSDVVDLTIHPAYQNAAIQGSPISVSGLPKSISDISNIYSLVRMRRDKGITIIIPIYNAPSDLEKCVKSLEDYTTVPCTVLLIDDKSPDPAISGILHRFESRDGWRVHRNVENLGFTKTVNLGIQLAGDDDVVFLNSDTIVSPGWLQGVLRR
jgi:hypothetical protein